MRLQTTTKSLALTANDHT